MFVPSATYRIQFHKDFTFRDLLPQIPYLKALGIDTIYASPIFKARPGSTHGYDVTDPNMLNPEIGSMEDFVVLQQALKKNGMYWLQDIVPNHMAFHPENAWLMDVFEKGPASEFYDFFDINWEYPDPAYRGKLMAPLLGETPEAALAAGTIKLVFTEIGFQIRFYENHFPTSLVSWPLILKTLAGNGIGINGKSKTLQEISALLLAFENSGNSEMPEKWLAKKAAFIDAILADPEFKKMLENGIEKLNKSPEMLQAILDKQFFRLELWSVSDQRINYRRFFTINELLCLRMENPVVFKKYHAFIFELCQKGYLQGLRIDHVDGLADPLAYLKNLREMVGENCYITVEKILGLGEGLPANWPVQGTTGYFFLAMVNQLFTRQAAEKRFDCIYGRHVPEAQEHDYEQLVFEKKTYMLENHMQGELDNLFAFMQQLELMPPGPGFSEKGLKEALQILLAAFPVYRLYPNVLPLTGQDAVALEKTFARAEKFALHLKKELAYFYRLFQGEKLALPGMMDNRLRFLKRCQQVTGPLAAKGVEDTVFYNFNRLISHNEVGDNPEVFGISAGRFHNEMQERQQRWPLAQNATATHDTKRGEDARMRLNVLSELTEDWAELLEKWEVVNKAFLIETDGQQAPSQNRVFFLYQTLLSAFPMDGEPEANFPERIQQAMTKAVREAKMYSNWSAPNETYENSLQFFWEHIFADGTAFKNTFLPFVKKLAFYGMLYSLGQTLLKITAPGIPDIYQGCERWDLSMVDPDNRRPVDFDTRRKWLSEMQGLSENARISALKNMLENWTNGKIKLYTTWRALHFRKANQPLFTQGEYLPLEISGKPNAIAFARKLGQAWCLVLAPLEAVKLTSTGQFPLGEKTWQNTAIALPEGAPQKWKNVFTNEVVSGEGRLALAHVFASFPVALLTPENL